MKITNEQLKQIIKEELQAVMNESESLLGLAALAAMRKQRAAAAKRKAAQGPLPRGGYKRGYGGPSSGSDYDAEKFERERERLRKDAAEQEAMERQHQAKKQVLDQLAQLKTEVYIQQNCPPQASCVVDVNEMDDMLNGQSFHEMLATARDYGEWDNKGYNDEYTTADLKYLFPGKYTPDQLPTFDPDDTDYYSDENYQSMVSGGYMDDDYSYDFTDKGKKMKKLLGF
jgi:hypothetical protein